MKRIVCRLAAVLLCFGPAAVRAYDATEGPAEANGIAPASPALVATLQELLQEGFVIGPRRLPAAQTRFTAAHNLAPADPRVDFAYGLVLLRQSENKQAIAQFEAAVAHKGPAYWPAWQALIWTQLVEKQYEKGLDHLDEFAALVRKSDPEAQATESEREAARWMGRLLEAVLKTASSRKGLSELIDQHDLSLRDRLDDELLVEFEVGRSMIDVRDAELSDQAETARETARSKQLQKKQGESSKLENDLKALGKEKETTTKTGEDWKKWLDKTLAEIDKQMGVIEKQYHDLELRSETIRQESVSIQRQITLLETQMNFRNPGASAQTVQYSVQQQQLRMSQLQNQYLQLQYEYQARMGQLNQTAELGRLGAQQRAAIVERYEQATGELVKKNAALDWNARLAENKKKKLEVLPTGKAKNAKAPIDAKPASLKAYVPLDLDAERARLLLDYGVKPQAPASVETKKATVEAKKGGKK